MGSSSFVVNFPDAYTTQAAQLAAQSQLEGIQYDIDQPFMTKWNVNVQRELFAKTMIEVGYSGSHGEHLVRQIYTNGRVAQVTADGRLFVAPGTPLAQPNFGRMRYRVSDGTSDYKGMTVGLTRRMSNGLQAQVSYTLSSSVDDGASALGGNDFTNEGAGGRYLYQKDRGPSPFDVRNAVVASVNYAAPVMAAGLRSVRKRMDRRRADSLSQRLPVPRSRCRAGLQVQGWAPEFDLRPGASANPWSARWHSGSTRQVLPATGFISNLPRNSIVGPTCIRWT